MSKPIADSVTQVALAALALDVCSDVVIQHTNEIAPSDTAGTPLASSATGYPSDGQLAPACGCQESLGTSAEQPPTTNSHANRILGSYARAACSVRDVEHAVARDVAPARSGAERIAVARGAVAGRYVDLVRAAAPDKLVVFEPSATRNLVDFSPKSSRAFPVANSVYAPRINTYVFAPDSPPLQNLDPADLEASVAGTRAEATAWHTPLMIGEYGIGPTAPNADLWMGVEAQLHARYLARDAFWVWKEESQGAWGVFDDSGA